MKVRAYVSMNEASNTHGYKDFEVIAKLPEVGETVYMHSGINETVKSIEPVKLDAEQGKSEVYNYNYYKIVIEEKEEFMGDVEINESVYYYAIEKEEK